MKKLSLKVSQLKSNRTSIYKAVFSVFIVYHLVVILVLGNGGSYLGRKFQAGILPYANTLGLNNVWNFFSPDPAHTMFIKYNVRFEDELGNERKSSVEGFLPEQKKDVVIDSSKRRFLYAMRYLILDSRRLELILGPYFCRSYPGATSISLQHLMTPIPFLDAAEIGQTNEDEVRTISVDYKCGQVHDEVSL